MAHRGLAFFTHYDGTLWAPPPRDPSAQLALGQEVLLQERESRLFRGLLVRLVLFVFLTLFAPFQTELGHVVGCEFGIAACALLRTCARHTAARVGDELNPGAARIFYLARAAFHLRVLLLSLSSPCSPLLVAKFLPFLKGLNARCVGTALHLVNPLPRHGFLAPHFLDKCRRGARLCGTRRAAVLVYRRGAPQRRGGPRGVEGHRGDLRDLHGNGGGRRVARIRETRRVERRRRRKRSGRGGRHDGFLV